MDAVIKDRMKSAATGLARTLGYDITHSTRTVAYREIEARLADLGPERLDALEIAAGWKWRQQRWASFCEMNWPDYDICKDRLVAVWAFARKPR